MQTDSTNTDMSTHHFNRFGDAYAFTRQDVQCTTQSNQLLTITEAIEIPIKSDAYACDLKNKRLVRMARKSYSSAMQETQKCALQ